MQRLLFVAIMACLAPYAGHTQWEMQDPHVTADLRGIDYVGSGVAWASGSHGTVLRTEDMGHAWQLCAVPPGAEDLDFRGVQAFDNNTAIVMSSGPGDKSRLYKTTDGCQTWTLVFTNPEKEGFWDAFRSSGDQHSGLLIGDPVGKTFPLTWIIPGYEKPNNFEEYVKAQPGEAAFAASNTALFVYSEVFWLATGGSSGARVIRKAVHGGEGIGWVHYGSSEVPVGRHTPSSGIFSLTFRVDGTPRPSQIKRGVAVGGDYLKAEDASGTAAYTADGGKVWKASTSMPHGYRSAVAFDSRANTWITVGPNGTDVSTDDGRDWRPLKPGPGEAPDADRNWNALSLPFVVGPKGRIGILRDAALEAKGVSGSAK